MLPEQQQRILGYFIEEAKDHLNTIEQGLLNLQSTVEDSELINEVFRAAHSVKGGAAMLGVDSIQRTAHRLEDYFKVLKECPIKVDQTLESLLFRVFDTLQELLEQLQGPFGLTEDKAEEAMTELEPVFGQLNGHLDTLVQEAGGMPPEAAVPTPAPRPVSATSPSRPSPSVHPEASALQLFFRSDVPAQLREMLQWFKQPDNADTRQQLQGICDRLIQAGEQFDLADWCQLVRLVRGAIAYPENTYRALAPVVIKDLKQGQELVLAGRITDICASQALEDLVPFELAEAVAAEDLLEGGFDDEEVFADLFSGEEITATEHFDLSDLGSEDEVGSDEDLGLDLLEAVSADPMNLPELGLEPAFGETETVMEDLELSEQSADFDLVNDLSEPSHSGFAEGSGGPEVGVAELNSLADLFEGEVPDLDETWQEEESLGVAAGGSAESFDIDVSSDFSDLLLEQEQHIAVNDATPESDLAALFGEDVFEQEGLILDDQESELEPDAEMLGLISGESSEAGLDEDWLLDADSPSSEPEDSALMDFEGVDLEQHPFEAEAETLFETLTEMAAEEDAIASNAPDVGTAHEIAEATVLPTSEDVDLRSDPWGDEPDEDADAAPSIAQETAFIPPEPVADPWAEFEDLADSSAQSNSDVAAGSDDDFFDSFESLDSSALSDEVLLDSATAVDDQGAMTASQAEWTESGTAEAFDALEDFEPLELEDTTSDEDLAALFGDDSTTGLSDEALFEDASLPETEFLELEETGPEDDLQALFGSEGSLDFVASDVEALEDAADVASSNPDEELFLDLEESAALFGDEPEDAIAGGTDELDESFSLELEPTEVLADTPGALSADDGTTDVDFIDFLGDQSGEVSEDEDFNLEFESSVESADLPDVSSVDDADFDLSLFEEDSDEGTLEAIEESSPEESLFAEATTDLDALDLDFGTDSASSTDEEADAFLLDLGLDEEGEAAWSDLDLGLEADEASSSELDLDLVDEASSEDLSDFDFSDGSALIEEPWSLEAEAGAESEVTFSATEAAEETEALGAAVDSSDEALDDLFGELGESNQEPGLAVAEFEWTVEETAESLAETEGTEAEADFDFVFLEEETVEESVEIVTDLSSVGEESDDLSLDLEWDETGSEASFDLEELDFSLDEAQTEGAETTELIWGSEEGLEAVASEESLAFDTEASPDLFFEEEAAIAGEPSAEVVGEFDESFSLVSDPDLIDQAIEADEQTAELDLAQDFVVDLNADLESSEESETLDLDDWSDAETEGVSVLDEAMVDESVAFEGVASELADFEVDAVLGEDESLETSDIDQVALDEDFSDLEALLGDDDLAAADAAPQMQGITESAADDEAFADLEALLGEEPAWVEEATEPSLTAASMDSDDEFEDLEKLLEDADQKLGGSPSGPGGRRSTTTMSRRMMGRRSSGVLSEQSMRVSVKHLDNLSNLVGELVVNRNSLEQDQERLRQFLDNLLYQVQQLSDVGQRMRDLYERSLLESSLLSSRQGYQSFTSRAAAAGQAERHATGVSFDALEMDRFTGFHTLSQEMIELIVRVREAASDIEFIVEETDQVTRNFRQVTTQLQEGLMRSRMVPFAQTADRLPRAVRDISIKCGKQAELVIEGRDTLIDKMILEQLYDPMTHLVNNAITHGIESPEARRASGKSEKGRIIVRAFHQGNQTVIVVSDDGAGINPDIVKEKAIRKGLISAAEAREMTNLDVYDLLFHPGFSTRDQADDFAGRGVGMDVVRTRLAEMRGAINIDSTVGKGTSFTIRLPLTLSISKALACISNRARIAFPMDGVEDMLDVPKDRIQVNEQGQTCILWRDTLLPFQPLSELLKYNRSLGRGSVYGGGPDDDVISIVVLRSAGTHIALEVDQVLGEQEIVIKQLQGPVPKPLGVAGATVLGDGRIMPIADVLELIDLSMGRIRRDAGSLLWEQRLEQFPPEPEDVKAEPTVLIVDDSITVRELLSMSFNKVGYRVEQARDGQEAWEKLRSGLPCDLVFCDIEMPRMDGLELLSRMQKDPHLNRIPIAMLTSRGADRHRQMAVDLGASGYFTKPYLEEALLDAAQRMLRGEVLVHRGNDG